MVLHTKARWCAGYHYRTISFNKAWTQVLRRFKSCSRHVISTTRTIHHHHIIITHKLHHFLITFFLAASFDICSIQKRENKWTNQRNAKYYKICPKWKQANIRKAADFAWLEQALSNVNQSMELGICSQVLSGQMFWKISQNSQENTYDEDIFLKTTEKLF